VSTTEHAAVLAGLGKRIAALERGLQIQPIPPSTDWTDVTLASGNWTTNETVRWRQEGYRVFLRGTITRTTSTFGATGVFFGLDTTEPYDNPPSPAFGSRMVANYIDGTSGSSISIFVYADVGADTFRTTTAGPALVVGTQISFDNLSYALL